jgi:hypothetical protein
MGRTPFDTFVKGVTVDALSPLGRAETDVRIAPDPQFADVCFEPTSPPAARDGDLLLRLTSEGPVMLEFARQAPDIAELGTWQGKQLAWWRRLQAAERREEQARWKRPPLFWGLSTGAPREALGYFGLKAMDASVWPRGCYAGAPGGRFRVVVISELPRERETIVVRTMGAGVTFRKALEDLAALPDDAPERTLVLPHLARLRLETENDEEDAMHPTTVETHRMYNEMRAKLVECGLRPLVRLFERRLARSLTEAERATLLTRLSSVGPDRLGDVVLDLDPPALAVWLDDPDAR